MIYLDREVFTRTPHRVQAAQEEQDAAVLTLDSTTGPRDSKPQSPTPARARTLRMPARDLGVAYELRAFVYRVRGRHKAFWVPSWQADLVLSAGASGGASSVLVRECGYATNLFPVGPARRHVGFREANGTLQIRKVMTATTDGTTETLGLDSPLSSAITTATLVMFMRYVRLDDDRIVFDWEGGTCFVDLPVRDLSEEVPA